ncbi:MAG: HAMP domain-containing histidine kinase [Acidobacteria bacterium]|nr:HAMP domain-containing histidine kinase [Acidobacteriota bacterium]
MSSQTASKTSAPKPWTSIRLGIFARVYAFDLLLAALAVVASILVMQYLVDSKLKNQVHSLARWMVDEAFDTGDRNARDRLLLRLYQSGRVRMTLYDANGRLVGVGGPAFPLPDANELAQLRRSGEEGFTGEEAKLSMAVYRGSSLLGYGFVGLAEPFSIAFGLIPAVLVLAAIALIAWPLAVSVLKPVRALGDTMTRFGAGDLSIRVARPGNDEIGELALGFNRLADRIRELLQSEKMLLASLSHDLRTPLQRVRLALELATDPGDAFGDEDHRRADARHLASVSADLNDLDELLSEILVVARLDEARTASDSLLNKQPVPPDELIAECVERFEAAHPERTVRWVEGPPLPLCELDPRFMKRAVLNLLDNAARYSPRTEPIEIASWIEAGVLVVEVRDGGPGIPPELHERIFEPFFRGEAVRGESSGSGLGLSIVQRIAKAHGGNVSVKSSRSGSTFRITLPRAGHPLNLTEVIGEH